MSVNRTLLDLDVNLRMMTCSIRGIVLMGFCNGLKSGVIKKELSRKIGFGGGLDGLDGEKERSSWEDVSSESVPSELIRDMSYKLHIQWVLG